MQIEKQAQAEINFAFSSVKNKKRDGEKLQG
jgi:hypothetical protein